MHQFAIAPGHGPQTTESRPTTPSVNLDAIYCRPPRVDCQPEDYQRDYSSQDILSTY